MRKLEFAVDEHPTARQRGRYGIVMMDGGPDRIQPIGDRTFQSPEAAIQAFARALSHILESQQGHTETETEG
jgi:hypothetical protein